MKNSFKHMFNETKEEKSSQNREKVYCKPHYNI